MKRILFVDDDRDVLNDLRHSLLSMAGEWQMDFADSAERAMDLMSSVRVDALVTDLGMQDIDGFRLLTDTREIYPQVLRVVLAQDAREDVLARSLETTHLFMGKPCDAEVLKRRMRHMLDRGDQIRDETLKSLVSQVGSVPSIPSVFSRLMRHFDAERPHLECIAAAVSMDMGMSSSVLHYANSGYFGPMNVTSNPARAVRWLGLDTTRELIVNNRVSAPFDAKGFHYFDAIAVWKRAVAVAAAARAFAVRRGADSVLADDAFAAGLFHDVGQLILAKVLGNFYDSVVERALSRGEPVWRSELELIGSTHGQVGAYLLGLWGIPDPVIQAIAAHHSDPDSRSELTALAAVQFVYQKEEQDICNTRF